MMDLDTECINMEVFSLRVQKHTKTMNSKQYALVSIDFDDFNFINDFFGYAIGDAALECMSVRFSSQMEQGEFFLRAHADHFIFCLHADSEQSVINRLLKLTDLKEALADVIYDQYHLVCSGGIVIIDEELDDLTAVLDKANFARKRAKGNHISTFLCYDSKMSEDLKWKKIITMTMESALSDNEFEMHLQPKIMVKTGAIVGAEALVRWNSKKYGMMYPNMFIPTFEQNGFINKLDFFMLEQVCKFLCESKAKGITLLPISVNFSKIHIRNENFVEQIFNLVRSYDISPQLIEIEFTESVFLDDFQALLNAASSLKYLGFKVVLDDFGAAYSSLNYLKDLPFDMIKIDKEFLKSYDTDKGKIVLAKMVELVKSLRMICLMEGVEEASHVEFLQKMSCDLGQGYFYARPMDQYKYEQLMQTADTVDYLITKSNYCDEHNDYLYVMPQEFEMDNWELYVLGKNIDMGLMKGYLDREATVQYVNDKALEYLGYNRQEFREIFNNSIIAFSHPDDAHIVQANAEQLVNSGKPLSFKTRAIRKDGKIIYLQGRASCVIDNHGRPIGIYAFQDVTEEMHNKQMIENAIHAKTIELYKAQKREKTIEEALYLSQKRYEAVWQYSSALIFEWDFAQNKVFLSKQCQQVFGLPMVIDDMLVKSKLRDWIHPDDYAIFVDWINDICERHNCESVCYRVKQADNTYRYVCAQTTCLCDRGGVVLGLIGSFIYREDR